MKAPSEKVRVKIVVLAIAKSPKIQNGHWPLYHKEHKLLALHILFSDGEHHSSVIIRLEYLIIQQMQFLPMQNGFIFKYFRIYFCKS